MTRIRRFTGLLDLPAEVSFLSHHQLSLIILHEPVTYSPSQLIQQIHLLALNPFFPQTCTLIHDNILSTSPSFSARYLLDLYRAYGPNDILVRALRHPVCTVEVAQEIQRIWDPRRYREILALSTVYPHSFDVDATLFPIATQLRVSEIPRRLFRLSSFETDQSIHPLLIYLFKTYHPSANSHKGYPLCRAVLTHNYPLITFLLDNGAAPAIKSNLAVEVAISMRDLKAVKMLVEYPMERVNGRPNKRRRVEDRIRVDSRLVELAMMKGSKEIVQYFVHDKGE